MSRYSHLIGGILLVSGTTIGAGMLALPVSTGLAGFVPSIFLILISWIYMTYTAFLILEVNLWMGTNTNLISMARNTLGRTGEVFCWIIYLFLLYLLTTAYIAGSGPIIIDFIQALTGINLPSWTGPIPLLGIFGYFVFRGTADVDFVNRLLMLGLVIAYIAMVVFLTPYVEFNLLEYADPKYLLVATSVIVTSFGFHIIIPTLTTYLNKDVRQLKLAIWIGSAIPFIVYLVWEVLALGIIPLQGSNGIVVGYAQGSNGAQLLAAILGSSTIAMTARFFAFFAIVTSFLGVSLSLSDFLADGFKIKKNVGGRIVLYILTFLPPLLFSLTYPRAFLSALEYAGAFGVIVLLGLLPALMVWRGRYYKHFRSTFKAWGGKLALALVMVCALFVIGLELANKLGLTALILK